MPAPLRQAPGSEIEPVPFGPRIVNCRSRSRPVSATCFLPYLAHLAHLHSLHVPLTWQDQVTFYGDRQPVICAKTSELCTQLRRRSSGAASGAAPRLGVAHFQRREMGGRRKSSVGATRKAKKHRSRQDLASAGAAAGQPALSGLGLFMETLKCLFNLRSSETVYDMQVEGEKERLADDLWSARLLSRPGHLTTANRELVELLNYQSLDRDDTVRDRPFCDRIRGMTFPRFESVLCGIFRCRSKFKVPLSTAALSVRFHHYKVPRMVWDAVTYLSPGTVMSKAWTTDFVAFASRRDPGCPYKVIDGITACAFDNYRIHSNYGSFATTESYGEAIDMVNWASLSLPASAAPMGFKFENCLGQGGLFRTDLVREEFIDSFSMQALDICQSKLNRWSQFLDCARDGTFGEKPVFVSPYPPTHLVHHEPMYDQGQSAYSHVNFQIKYIRTSRWHKHSKCMFAAGDGLLYMRMIHRLAQNPMIYLNSLPMVIPVLGEHPHGSYHLMDGGWKLWWPFLEQITLLLENRQIVGTPNVSKFNEHEMFLVHVVGRAVAEYVVEIAATGTDYHNATHFMRQAEQNYSFSIVVHFLFDFVFLFMQFRNGVRTNNSHDLDRCWREFLSIGRTDAGNKTNYTQMSIVRVYWGRALNRQLSELYHNVRTLRFVDTHVGWDMFIEKVNLLIAKACTSHITRESISKFLSTINFTQIMNRTLEAIVHRGWSKKRFRKGVDADVEIIKKHLREKIGTTYAEATAPSTQNTLDINLATWGGSVAGRHMTNRPWQQTERTYADYRDYVGKQLAKLCHWHKWR